MLNYLILGIEILVFLWFMAWVYTSQIMKIYTLLQLEANKQTRRSLQWEFFVLLGCSAIFLYALLRVLLSGVI